MTSAITAAVRTAVQALIGLLVSVPLINELGIVDEIESFLVALGIGVVTLVLRWLEDRFPVLTPILSLGTTKVGPSYDAP